MAPFEPPRDDTPVASLVGAAWQQKKRDELVFDINSADTQFTNF